MIKGIYKAASGMLPQIRKQEVISNNLANASTPGFKREGMFLQELSQARGRYMPKQEKWEIPMYDDIYTDYSQSVLERTGDPMNLALDGRGFMVVQSEDGQSLYTRAGNFTVSPEGLVTTPDGYALQTDAGPIQIEPGNEITVGMDGFVMVNGEERGRLQLVTFENMQRLERLDGSVFRAPEDERPIEPERLWVRQGYIETANVDVIREMVDMIQSFREYESSQKAIQIEDETLGKTVNEVGAKS